MSPRRSNTIWRPSGLTSTFIHVPSDVSNSSFCVGPRSAVTSHFLLSDCWALVSATEKTKTAPTARIFFILLSSVFFLRSSFFGRVLEASPQKPARDRSVGAPDFADLADAIGFRFFSQPIEALNRRDDP